MNDAIVTAAGRPVGQWDGREAESLKLELERIRKQLASDGALDRVTPAGVPHAEQLPEDLRTFRAYPIWGCDAQGRCLCGANANRIVTVNDVRQYSLIDHH